MCDRKARPLTDAEAALWREVIKTVTPTTRFSPASVNGKAPAISNPEEFKSVQVNQGAPARRADRVRITHQHDVPTAHLDVAPLVVDAPQGTDRRTAQRLKRGKLEIDARLDLHGYSLAAGHTRLLGFLRATQAHGGRCVLIVTGKGRGDSGAPGKLKSAVPEWLNEPLFRPLVLSVTHAQQKDGGTGALYILLRKARGHVSAPGDGVRR